MRTAPRLRAKQALAIPTVIAALAILSGCQTYEAMPLDLDKAKRERQARSLDNHEFQQFAKQLEEATLTQRVGEGDPLSRSTEEQFSVEDGLAMWEAEAVCLFFSPDLRKTRIAAGIPYASWQEAGKLDNPTLGFDLKHIFENISNPWVIGAAIGFSFPLSDRRDMERAAIYAEYGVAVAEVLEAEWMTVAELRRMWVDFSVLAQRRAAVEEIVAEVGELARIADRLQEAGALSVVDARSFQIQLATLRNDLADLDNQREVLRTKLLAAMGLLPEAEIELLPDASLRSAGLIRADEHKLALEQRSPTLKKLAAEHTAAERALELEIEKQIPDFGLGGGYENEAGTSKAGLGFGIPLPIFDLNEQAIAEAMAKREVTWAAYNAAWEREINQLAIAKQRVHLADAQIERLGESIAPILDRQLSDLQALAKLGQIDALMTLDTLVRRYELKQRVIDSRAESLAASIEISVLIGPPQKLSPWRSVPGQEPWMK